MINLIQSPYYLSYAYADANITGAKIDLYIYTGDKTTGIPAQPTISLTHTRPSVDTANMDIDISNIVRSYIDPKPAISIANPSNLINSNLDDNRWVYYDVTWLSTGTPPANETGTIYITDGYGYYDEGVNPSNTNVLTSAITRYVSQKGIILLPFVNNKYDSLTVNGVSTPIIQSEVSNEYVKYISIDCSKYTDNIEVVLLVGAAGIRFRYKIVDECLYAPINVIFKNKYGVFDTLTMFKKSVLSLSIEKEKFINNYVSGGSYDTTRHQFNDINIQGTEKIKCNSGFIKENETELYKQMLLSDKVYFYENRKTTFKLIPVIVASKSIDYKTLVNDRLINYAIDFDYAYNTIQTI